MPSPVSEPLGEEDVEELKEEEEPDLDEEEVGLRQEYRRKLRRLRTSKGKSIVFCFCVDVNVFSGCFYLMRAKWHFLLYQRSFAV